MAPGTQHPASADWLLGRAGHRAAGRPLMLAGFHPVYLTVAITGAVVMLAIATLAFAITRRSKYASRIIRVGGERIPGLTGERLERAIVKARNSLSALAGDRRSPAA